MTAQTTAIPTLAEVNARQIQSMTAYVEESWAADCNRLWDVRKGATAKVVKGRKVKVGTEGTIIWIGDSQYGERVGLATAMGTQFTAVENVQVVVDPEDLPALVLDQEEIEAEAAAQALRYIEGEQFKAIEKEFGRVTGTHQHPYSDDTDHEVVVPEGYSAEGFAKWLTSGFSGHSSYNYFGGYTTSSRPTVDGQTVRWTTSYHIGE